MKYLYLTLILFVTTNVKSQTWFPDGKTWRYDVISGQIWENYGIHTLTVQPGDTSILEQKWKVLKWKGITENKQPSYFREESKKVFVYIDYLNKSFLLFDFNLEKGDTLLTRNRRGVIEETGTLNVNNKTLNWQLVRYKGHLNYTYRNFYVEGIGISNDTIVPGISLCGFIDHLDSCRAFVDGWDYRLKCVTDSNGSYPNPACNISSVDNTQEKDVIIQPNPTTDYIDIISPYGFSSIEVFNTNGMKVATLYHSLSIETTSWNSGIYIVKLTTKSRDVIYRKVVKS